MKLGVLASGNLGLVCLKQLHQEHEICFVMTNSASEEIHHYCFKDSIPIFSGNPRKKDGYQVLLKERIDVLVSINYLFIVNEDILHAPDKIAINIHGSLLPKYRGRTPHVWAIINDEEMTGVTVHKMVKECDAGDIILQKRIPIDPNDTGADILERFAEIYPNMLLETLRLISEKNYDLLKQNNKVATEFGKRIPEDGLINWNWQKRRIYNWVRAQCQPYPGAYTFAGDEKIIIDRISFDDCGYHGDLPNGSVISLDPIRVKTPNGLVRLELIRNGSHKLEIGQILKSYVH